MAAVAERISWALDLLDPVAGDRVLEIGCGPGVAVALLAERVSSVTALDRSATALARTLARNEEAVAEGRVVLHHGALAGFETDVPFDRALAVNVNAFWTGAADAEGDALARVLVPGGRVCLVYDRGDVHPAVAGALERHGFTTEVRHHPGGLVAVLGARR